MKVGQKIITVISLILLILSVFFVSNFLIWKVNYQNKIFPQTKIGNLDLSNQTTLQAKSLIQNRIKEIKKAGLSFKYKTKVITIPSEVASFDVDLSYSLLAFNTQKTLAVALGNRNQRTFTYYLLAKFKLISPRLVPAQYTLDQKKIKKIVGQEFSTLNVPANNAYFSVSKNKPGLNLQINSETLGRKINYSLLFEKLNASLVKLNNKQIIINTQAIYPNLKKSDLENLKPQVKKIINRGDFSLQLITTTSKYWEISPQEIITWISLQKSNNQSTLSLNLKKIEEYLKIHIAPSVDRVAIKPSFKVINKHISNWQNGKNGQKLDLIASALQINKAFLAGKNSSKLIVKQLPDESLIKNNTADIQNVLGIGKSNFTGSPANRVYNIEVGASSLQGLLIKPGAEFSLVKALGAVNAQSGYLKELVIKGDKTIPEYGGGLCQIATTLFRTALASGLPITMRENHSYQVAYYNPPGTDATMYDPLPDFRFMNNTKHYILIQAKIVKGQLSFIFWGTSDGRIATTSAPVIYNIVKPEPTKIIKTDTLKPGVEKCTEGSHNGLDAYFNYTVTYPPDSTTTPIHKRRFYSHYVPWQGVCLVGATASSTKSLKTNLKSGL